MALERGYIVLVLGDIALVRVDIDIVLVRY
jgi:hypothetical protein